MIFYATYLYTCTYNKNDINFSSVMQLYSFIIFRIHKIVLLRKFLSFNLFLFSIILGMTTDGM